MYFHTRLSFMNDSLTHYIMSFSLLIPDSYGRRLAPALSKKGVCCLPSRPGLGIGDVLSQFIGPEKDFDNPCDPFDMGSYKVS